MHAAQVSCVQSNGWICSTVFDISHRGGKPVFIEKPNILPLAFLASGEWSRRPKKLDLSRHQPRITSARTTNKTPSMQLTPRFLLSRKEAAAAHDLLAIALWANSPAPLQKPLGAR